jgi:hypothetical protein
MLFTKFLFIIGAAATAIPLALKPLAPGDLQLTGEQYEAIRNGSSPDWTEVADFNPDVPKDQRPVPANDLSKRQIKLNIAEFGLQATFDCPHTVALTRQMRAQVELPFDSETQNRGGFIATWSNILNVDAFDPLPRVQAPQTGSVSTTAIHNFCLTNPTTSPPTRCSYKMQAPLKTEYRINDDGNNYLLYPYSLQMPTLYEVCFQGNDCPVNRILRTCTTREFHIIA